MTARERDIDAPGAAAPGGLPRRRRWRRRLLVVVVLLVAIIAIAVAAIGSYVGQSAPPPLALPATAAAPPVGSIEGTWDVASGSMAGFRIEQTVLGMRGDIAGRTDAVTGQIVVAGDRITAAEFRIDLTTITAGGKAPPQLALSLETARFPDATFTLTQPLVLDAAFRSGQVVTATATGELTMHGMTRPVSIALSGRRDGTTLQAAGSIPVLFSDWDIPAAEGYGFLGSLADRGVAEFLVTMERSGAPG